MFTAAGCSAIASRHEAGDALAVRSGVLVFLVVVVVGCRSGFDVVGPDSGDDVPPTVGIASGDRFSCALRPGGTVWCWGDGRSGQLGDGTLVPRATAGPVQG